MGLAMYDVTDARPDGVTKDGITFRRTVADDAAPRRGDRRLGQTDVSTSYVVPRGRESLHVLCTGLPKGGTVHVWINGRERLSGDCNDSETFDPGTGTSYTFRMSHPGRTVPLRVWVSSGGLKRRSALAAGSAPRPAAGRRDLRPGRDAGGGRRGAARGHVRRAGRTPVAGRSGHWHEQR